MPDQLQRNSTYIFQVEPKRGFLIWINVVTTVINKKLSKICVYHLSGFIFPELFWFIRVFLETAHRSEREGACLKLAVQIPQAFCREKSAKAQNRFSLTKY